MKPGLCLRERAKRGEIPPEELLERAADMRRAEPWNDAGLRLVAWATKRVLKLHAARCAYLDAAEERKPHVQRARALVGSAPRRST